MNLKHLFVTGLVIAASLVPSAVSASSSSAANGLCFLTRYTIIARTGEVTYGTPGDDVIVGSPKADTIYGLGGNDLICGQGGGDKLYGGDGSDKLAGEGGSDRLYGEAGDDFLYGGGGNDKHFGGPGYDRCASYWGSHDQFDCEYVAPR